MALNATKSHDACDKARALPKMLVCDLDNTLYDWLDFFVPAFYAMVDEAVEITGCSKEALLDDLQKIHMKHHDVEHPFSLLEADTITYKYPRHSRKELAQELDRAFYKFNSVRKQRLRLFPGVIEAFSFLRSVGVVLIAHTESRLFTVVDRLTKLELMPFFRTIYCRERPESSHPDSGEDGEWLDRFPMQKICELKNHQRKPDPNVLAEICHREGFGAGNVAYVGDSIPRDIAMAKKAGVFGAWAAYGANASSDMYARLVRISHWTDEDIQREKELRRMAQDVQPDITLECSFYEIITKLEGRAVGTQ